MKIVDGSEKLYRKINIDFMQCKINTLFINEYLDLYSWRKSFFRMYLAPSFNNRSRFSLIGCDVTYDWEYLVSVLRMPMKFVKFGGLQKSRFSAI